MDALVRSTLLVLLCCFLYTIPFKVEGIRKLSKEEDLELEQQLTRLNKPAVKTIESKYGVLYDCVDFYKQPAFDHPSLKNHDFHFQMKPSSVPKRTTEKKSYVANNTRANHAKREVIDCPFGTVPIRRVTKADLIRNKLHKERFGSDYSMLFDDDPGTHYAVVQTKNQPGVSYNGGGTSLAIYNPQVENSQYSKGRIKIQNGIDSIQYGWMVNPTLYGDNATHEFIHLQTSQSQCFNVLCPGFILVNSDYPVDAIITNISRIGGKKFKLPLLIYKDELNGNWWLEAGLGNDPVGFWPQRIFTDLAGKATSVQWGGEVSGPAGVSAPSMGSGRYVGDGEIPTDAFCEQMTTINDAHKVVDAVNTETYRDDKYSYNVRDKGYVDSYFRHIMFYGGTKL